MGIPRSVAPTPKHWTRPISATSCFLCIQKTGLSHWGLEIGVIMRKKTDCIITLVSKAWMLNPCILTKRVVLLQSLMKVKSLRRTVFLMKVLQIRVTLNTSLLWIISCNRFSTQDTGKLKWSYLFTFRFCVCFYTWTGSDSLQQTYIRLYFGPWSQNFNIDNKK